MHNSFYIVLCLVQISLPRVQSKYFAYFKTPETWLQANNTCTECGGKLVNWNENVSEIVSHNNIQHKIVWIGNYTRQYPWLREIGCAKKSDLKYNFIYQNTPEFCSRTCKHGQHFAIEGEKCYCVTSSKTIDYTSCQDTDMDCQYTCMDEYVTVLTIDNVYTCDFENISCSNTSFGEEERGLVWTRDIEIDSHLLLLQGIAETAENKARLSIRLNLEKLYYCLSFKYYMSYGGSIEVYVSKESGEKYVAWKKYGNKGDMWYSSVVDVKGHSGLTIDIYGSIENVQIGSDINKIALDDIKLKPLACDKDVLLNCTFLTDMCDLRVENGLVVFLKKYKGLNSLIVENYGTEIDKIYTMRTTSIKVTSTTTFCLKFSSYTYGRSKEALEIFTEIGDTKTLIWTRNYTSRRSWYNHSISFTRNAAFVILIEIVRLKSSTYYDIKIANLIIESGHCNEGADTTESAEKRMCSAIDFGDSSRLSVGYCSNMKRQPYICEFGDNHFKSTTCSSAQLMNASVASATTNVPLKTTTVKRETIATSSRLPILSTPESKSNVSKQISKAEEGDTRIEFVVGFGILLAVVVALLVLAVWLFLKLKRYQGSGKENAGLERVLSIQSHGHQMTSSGTSEVPLQTTASATEYELASPNHLKRRRDENKYDSLQNVHQSEPHSDYQNCDNFTSKKRHESQVYQEMEEGNYDHLRKSAERRKNFNSKGDNLYDHGQPVNSQNNDMYDKSKTGTGENYFVLEPENYASRESAIYDHAISNTFRKC